MSNKHGKLWLNNSVKINKIIFQISVDGFWWFWNYKIHFTYPQTDRNYKKEPNRNFKAEEYNNLIENFTKGAQEQCSSIRRKNFWTWRYVIWNYPFRGQKKYEKQWRKPKGLIGHYIY